MRGNEVNMPVVPKYKYVGNKSVKPEAKKQTYCLITTVNLEKLEQNT